MANEAVVATGFLDAARQSLLSPAILEQHATLTPPRAETARLEGHFDGVRTLCVLPDGRLASGSNDRTIRLWDVTTGAETARLEGHSDGVIALCVLPDGRLASGSNDRTIRLWDVTTDAETARLEADAPLLCLAALADLHLVAGDTLGRLHWLEVVVRHGSTHDKDSMGNDGKSGLVRWDRRHWHCMEETNAPPHEGIG
jgi:WD40 repeat protein